MIAPAQYDAKLDTERIPKTGAYDAVPKELDQQAQIDGASTMQILLKIILPVAVAGLASTGVLCFVLAWNERLTGIASGRAGVLQGG